MKGQDDPEDLNWKRNVMHFIIIIIGVVVVSCTWYSVSYNKYLYVLSLSQVDHNSFSDNFNSDLSGSDWSKANTDNRVQTLEMM